MLLTKNGRKIGYERTGEGPNLVLVHGGFLDRSSWAFVQPLLAQHFTVYAIDRLGHGESDPYSANPTFEDEVNVIRGFLEELNAPVYLVGHSAGARIALYAVLGLHGSLVQKIALYEPPEFTPLSAGLEQQLNELLAKADRENLALIALNEVVGKAAGVNSQSLEMLKQSPLWQMLYRNALSIPAELHTFGTFQPQAGEFKDFTLPVLLLEGTISPEFSRQCVERLHNSLTNNTVVALEGQGHGAIFTAPQLLANKLLEFWKKD